MSKSMLNPDDLTPEARAALGRVYRFLLSLKRNTTSTDEVEGPTALVASDALARGRDSRGGL